MPIMVQIRNVPEPLHRKLKARAALAGMSLSNYLLGELRRSAETPTRQELLERLSRRVPVKLTMSAADAVRAEREAR
jgi:plasmid stability protein